MTTQKTQHGNPSIRNLAALYEDAKARVGRSLSIYNDVSDMIDRLEGGESPGAEYDALCQKLRRIA